MKRRLVALGVLAFFSATESARAQDAGGPDRGRVVARVGTRTITLGEVQDRMDAVPRFQLAMFGNTPDEIRKRFFDEVVLREVLYSEGAKSRGLEKKEPVAAAIRKSEAESAVRVMERGLPPITKEDVVAYFEAHRTQFESPEKINLWRILCKSKEEAEKVLAAAKAEPTEKKFVELADAHSVDKSSHLRGGSLGFVRVDGVAEGQGAKVDAAVVRAASLVGDGEFVGEPIVEGANFAVIWRRGHVAAQKRTATDLEAQLRPIVAEQRRLKVVRERTEALRAQWVKDEHPEYLDWLELPAFDAGVLVRKTPAK